MRLLRLLPLLLLGVLLAPAASSQITTPLRGGTTVGATTTFERPSELGDGTSGTSCSPLSTGPYAYDIERLIFSASGEYDITVASDFDTVLYLYEGQFNPGDPCLNLVDAVDERFAGSTPEVLEADITAGVYTLVVTSFVPTTGGAYTGRIDGPGLVRYGTVDYLAGPVNLAIPDNIASGTTSTIQVPSDRSTTASRVIVFVDIAHTFVGDLTLELEHGGASSTLLSRPGAGGCSGNDMSIIFQFDSDPIGDDACQSGANPAPAFPGGGSFAPTTSLNVFEGMTTDGTWTLSLSDNAAADTGTLNTWALIVSSVQPVDAEDGADAFASSLTVAPNPISGSAQINFTVGTSQEVRVALYDAMGREVGVLFEREVAAGQQALVHVNTSDLASGVYVVRASGPSLSLSERVTVVR